MAKKKKALGEPIFPDAPAPAKKKKESGLKKAELVEKPKPKFNQPGSNSQSRVVKKD